MIGLLYKSNAADDKTVEKSVGGVSSKKKKNEDIYNVDDITKTITNKNNNNQ